MVAQLFFVERTLPAARLRNGVCRAQKELMTRKVISWGLPAGNFLKAAQVWHHHRVALPQTSIFNHGSYVKSSGVLVSGAIYSELSDCGLELN